MSTVGKWLRTIGAEITILFGKNLPKGWEADSAMILDLLNKAKKWEASAGAITLAALVPDNIGVLTLQFLQKVTNEGIVTLEIAQGAAAATSETTDPIAKADAIIAYVVANIGKLPPEWQNKHWEDIAVHLLEALLNIATTEAKAIVALQYAKA